MTLHHRNDVGEQPGCRLLTIEDTNAERGRTNVKKIGLVGGMTPESTLAYYRAIIDLGRQRWNDPVHNPIVIIYSIDLAEMVAYQDVGDEDSAAGLLVEVLERLRGAGAEVGALTANTPHVFFDRIQSRTDLPLVDIVQATLEHAAELRVERALLLGTKATMAGAMYPKAFAAREIEIVVPDEPDRDFINRSIYSDLAAGEVTPELRRAYLDICHRQIDDRGIDAVILGCTEIPLVLSAGDLPVHLIDTARCHAEAIFGVAVSNER
jgi:aspartate racemase